MDDIVSLHEMADQLSISTDWLKEMAETGQIPHLKADRRTFFNPAAVRRALARMAAGTEKGSSAEQS